MGKLMELWMDMLVNGWVEIGEVVTGLMGK